MRTTPASPLAPAQDSALTEAPEPADSASPAELFRALADPVRLRLLALLADGEVCVCDLTTVLGEPQPSVSRHLARLRRAGLVTVRRAGKWKHYSLNGDIGGLGAALLADWTEHAQRWPMTTDDMHRLKQLPRTGRCA